MWALHVNLFSMPRVKTEARYHLRELAKISGKSAFILKSQLRARKITGRWISYLLFKEERRARVFVFVFFMSIKY